MDVIEATMEKWHQHLRGQLPGGLDELLHEDCVFYSPVVFTPQRGKAITKMYLEAAGQALPGEPDGGAFGGDASSSDKSGSGKTTGSFRYTKKILSGQQAALEFETTVEGKVVNGIDIIIQGHDPAAAGGSGSSSADESDAGLDAELEAVVKHRRLSQAAGTHLYSM
jgi:hypothetical protein